MAFPDLGQHPLPCGRLFYIEQQQLAGYTPPGVLRAGQSWANALHCRRRSCEVAVWPKTDLTELRDVVAIEGKADLTQTPPEDRS